MIDISRLPSRLLHKLSADRAQHRLERDFGALLAAAADAHQALAPRLDGPKVGFATFGSGSWHFVLEALLAHALALRGARPELLICDMPTLPICDERTIHSNSIDRCTGCIGAKRTLVDLCGIPWRGVSEFVPPQALAKARAIVSGLEDAALTSYEEAGWPIGRWLHVSGCHFLRCDERGDQPEKIDARRRLLTTAIVIVEAVGKWLDETKPEVLIAESGAHFMWRIASELAQARGIRVVCREMGKGGWDSHIYALDADSMSPNLAAAWAEARETPLSEAEESEVERYLEHLPSKTYVQKTPAVVPHRAADLRTTLGVPPEKRLAVLFTNVTWDLATAGRDVAFRGVLDWTRETIRRFSALRDVSLVVRAHPAEASVLTRERILDQIALEWPVVPDNLTLIAPEQPVSVPDLCAIADAALVYCSTTGVEAALYGKPVLLCGAPHFRGKGFTIDISSREEYAALLSQWSSGAALPAPPRGPELARRYFHLFFLRYQIQMGWTTSPLEPPYRLTITSGRDLEVGRNASLDLVCSGILEGRLILQPRQPPAVQARRV